MQWSVVVVLDICSKIDAVLGQDRDVCVMSVFWGRVRCLLG
jgi:hypothetical protein